jgi:hypothetical protein
MISSRAVQSESALTAPAFFFLPLTPALHRTAVPACHLSLFLSIPGPAVPWKLRSECRLENGRRRQLVKVRRRTRRCPSSPPN